MITEKNIYYSIIPYLQKVKKTLHVMRKEIESVERELHAIEEACKESLTPSGFERVDADEYVREQRRI